MRTQTMHLCPCQMAQTATWQSYHHRHLFRSARFKHIGSWVAEAVRGWGCKAISGCSVSTSCQAREEQVRARRRRIYGLAHTCSTCSKCWRRLHGRIATRRPTGGCKHRQAEHCGTAEARQCCAQRPKAQGQNKTGARREEEAQKAEKAGVLHVVSTLANHHLRHLLALGGSMYRHRDALWRI